VERFSGNFKNRTYHNLTITANNANTIIFNMKIIKNFHHDNAIMQEKQKLFFNNEFDIWAIRINRQCHNILEIIT